MGLLPGRSLSFTMKKIGLALSGGGFRATLYHLGLVRFLRDAGILSQVTHITAVSGGSIIAAHLGLNWNRYTGSASEFDDAANELLALVRMDLRNRIVRRYGLGFALRGPRRLLGLSNRRLTRTGLLEYLYERYLYGDTSLFQLPENPQLHLLATNLSEGRLCSFHRDGLWMICREAGHSFRIDHLRIGLATVPMAVAASSAFPGFFPPMELTGADVGARSGEFGRQAYTDGGVFDNLGVRMFRFLALSSASGQSPWDGVLVSDVGKPFEIQSNAKAGGLIRTAMRASDILMDRVWQLENETFKDTPGFVFARITDAVDPEQDPTALHPEVQRQLPSIRTDLDRFSALEISSLIRQGYCVGRQTCRSRPELFGADLPQNPPWDPIFDSSTTTTVAVESTNGKRPSSEPTRVTQDARKLHASAVRRIWRTLLDYRDWASYVYVPIIVPVLVLLPYFLIKSYERSQRVSQIVESLAQGSRDLEQMTRLMEGPVTPWTGERAEEPGAEKADLSGFLILQDMRIIDLRKEKLGAAGKDPNSYVYGYRRLKVQKKPDNAGNNLFRVSVVALSPATQVRFPPQQLEPRLFSHSMDNSGRGERLVHWEVGADFAKVPAGESVDLIYEHLSPGLFLREGAGSASLTFIVEAETVELTRWLLMPKGQEYRSFHLIRYETGKPETAENVKLVTEYLANDYTILAFKLLALKGGYTYELTWSYR
jgi:predicted acylesterase/phospholipase RssA